MSGKLFANTPIDTRTFQQFDPSNASAYRQLLPAWQAAQGMVPDIAGTAAAFAGSKPDQQAVLDRVRQAMTDPMLAGSVNVKNPFKEYPMAGQMVDGRYVRDHIPNTSSIPATFTDYETLKGIRDFPMSEFNGRYEDTPRTRKLAEDIKESGEINPLIVAIDEEGPYILEGGHRFDALGLSGAKSFPAMVVYDRPRGLLTK